MTGAYLFRNINKFLMEKNVKKLLIVLLLLVFTVGSVCAEDVLKTQQEKVGYAIGMNIATNMMQQELDIDADQLAAGLTAVLKGRKPFYPSKRWARF